MKYFNFNFTLEWLTIIMFIIMPMNGYIAYNRPWIGVALVLIQLPWFIVFLSKLQIIRDNNLTTTKKER